MKWLFSLAVTMTFYSTQTLATTVRIGNGGDTSEGSSVSTSSIADLIYQSKKDISVLISSWLNVKFGVPLSQKELLALSTVVQSTPVEINIQKPCFDGTKDKDAVAFQNPSQICISAFLLQKKVTTANYKAQVISLLVHEYSHLIGFDEAKAQQVQQFTLQYVGTYGYPEIFSRGDVDDFTLLEPYSIFEGLWSDKIQLSEEIKIYTHELRAKMMAYAEYSKGPYQALPTNKNYTGDILVRLNYLNLVSKAYWQRFPSTETQEQLKNFFRGHDGIDITYFNTSELNSSPQVLNSDLKGLVAINYQSTEADFKNLILEIDSLKRAMEKQLWSTLKR